MRAIATLPLLAAVALLPGCIIEDIHDQIALSNGNLNTIENQLVGIDENLDTVNSQVAQLQQQLDATNAHLTDLRGQLDATNAHLASLRKTINNIDETIPFLKLSGDEDEDKEALEDGTTGQTPPPTTDQPADTQPTNPPKDPPR